MAGPGSRLEKAGTVFTRIRGLLRSGALKESEKPLWYEVYEAFPPRTEPKYVREIPAVDPINILYKEDLVRAKFYKTFGNPDILDMNDDTPSLSQIFVDKYFEIQKSGEAEKGEIFSAAINALRSEGFKLKTLEEISQEREEALARRLAAAREAAEREASNLDVSYQQQDEAEDTIDEDVLNPDYDDMSRKDDKR